MIKMKKKILFISTHVYSDLFYFKIHFHEMNHILSLYFKIMKYFLIRKHRKSEYNVNNLFLLTLIILFGWVKLEEIHILKCR